jgi:eukaryotic-like serine/threonine-protein kinase
MLVQSSPVPLGTLGRPRKQHGKRALATLLREHGVFSTAHAADVALDVCDALANAHANGVVHGQLGLRCVRLTISPEGPREVEIFTLTAEGDSEVAQRAAPFLAPEQRDLARQIDARADIWGLGALLYTMVVGQVPPAANASVPPETMPTSFASVVEACLAADPASRPQDVDELTEKIASFATWPPDRFARLAERRELRASAARARIALEARGLENMPAVLDKLDEAALTRAQREATPKTATMSSILERPTSKAALARLMAVVYEGTEAARLETAAELSPLVDFDDDDELVLPTTVHESVREEPIVLATVASPLATVPMFLPVAVLQPPAPEPTPPSRSALPFVGLAIAALLLSVGVGYGGYMMSSKTTPPPVTVAAPVVAPEPPAPAPIPVFNASALPEVAPVTPGSLPDAKR